MKRKIASFLIAGSCALSWAGACSSTVAEGDSESHFLSLCPPGCPSGLECVCGACTRLCVGDVVCGTLVSNATCVNHPSCGASKVCDVACRSDSDCGSLQGTSCVQGFCRGQGQVPSEAGVGTGGTDASIHPDGKSTGGRGTGGSGGAFAETGAGTGGRANGSGGDASTLPEASPGTDGAPNGGFPASGGRPSFVDVEAYDARFGWLDLNTLPAAPAYLDWHGEPLSPPGTGGCCTPGDIHWTQEGGGDSTEHRLTRCSYYLRGADHPNEDCIASLSCGGDRVSPTDVAAVLNQADVRAAFTAAPTAFGLATGLENVITIDGNRVSIGAPCAGAPGCTDAPADLLSLVTTLHQLAMQQLGWQCTASVDCYAPVDPGPCDGAFPRYGYDVVSGKCQPFTYGGCAGTANRFETLATCEEACKLDPCYAGHPVDPEAGSCIHAGPYCLEDPNAACGCACMYGPSPGGTPHQCTASGNVMTCVH